MLKLNQINVVNKFGVLAVSVLVTSCGYKSDKASSSPFSAIVMNYTGTDSSGKAQFAVQAKNFVTLTDLDHLDGTYVTIMQGGNLDISNINGSIVSATSFTGGSSPSLRYRMDGGTAVALDYSTMAMFSAYYQLDQIYANLQAKTGVAPTDIQANLPGGKHTVLFEPNIKYSGNGQDASAGIKLNAAFSPSDKKFLLFQRSPIESMPLAGNYQVLSHEFGHALFDYSFYSGKYVTSNRWAGEYAISGINEGFADFNSWIFTGCSDILRASINFSNLADERDFIKSTFTYDDLNAVTPTACTGEFYCIGTLFARSLYQAWSSMQSTVNTENMSNGTIAILKNLQATLNAMDSSIMPPQADRSTMSFSDAYARDGKITGAFIRAFIIAAPSTWKTSLCTAFENNFGVTGFPTVARTGSCN